VRAQRLDDNHSAVALNHYLLTEVYDLNDELLTTLLEHSREFRRGNDVRTNRFLGVDRDWVDRELAPAIFAVASGE
jgi:DNA-binding protein Fis